MFDLAYLDPEEGKKSIADLERIRARYPEKPVRWSRRGCTGAAYCRGRLGLPTGSRHTEFITGANNLHLFADAYSEIPCSFVDVGWGSDVAKCGRTFRDAFLNLRLSPARILQESVEAIRYDAKQLLELSRRTTGVGLCCMNMDHGTPDPNVVVLIDVSGEMR
jgi:hypothetical protein